MSKEPESEESALSETEAALGGEGSEEEEEEERRGRGLNLKEEEEDEGGRDHDRRVKEEEAPPLEFTPSMGLAERFTRREGLKRLVL